MKSLICIEVLSFVLVYANASRSMMMDMQGYGRPMSMMMKSMMKPEKNEPDERCKKVGQYLTIPGEQCKFLVCDYGHEPWKDAYGNIKLFTVEMPCAPGTFVQDASTNGYAITIPCEGQHAKMCLPMKKPMQIKRAMKKPMGYGMPMMKTMMKMMKMMKMMLQIMKKEKHPMGYGMPMKMEMPKREVHMGYGSIMKEEEIPMMMSYEEMQEMMKEVNKEMKQMKGMSGGYGDMMEEMEEMPTMGYGMEMKPMSKPMMMMPSNKYW